MVTKAAISLITTAVSLPSKNTSSYDNNGVFHGNSSFYGKIWRLNGNDSFCGRLCELSVRRSLLDFLPLKSCVIMMNHTNRFFSNRISRFRAWSSPIIGLPPMPAFWVTTENNFDSINRSSNMNNDQDREWACSRSVRIYRSLAHAQCNVCN